MVGEASGSRLASSWVIGSMSAWKIDETLGSVLGLSWEAFSCLRMPPSSGLEAGRFLDPRFLLFWHSYCRPSTIVSNLVSANTLAQSAVIPLPFRWFCFVEGATASPQPHVQGTLTIVGGKVEGVGSRNSMEFLFRWESCARVDSPEMHSQKSRQRGLMMIGRNGKKTA